MTYSKLGNIKGPQGRRGLNMTGNTTPPQRWVRMCWKAICGSTP